MKIYGQVEEVAFENLAADPVNLYRGRFWLNTTSYKPKIKGQSAVLNFLLNDDKIIIGTSGTAASNIRLMRSAAGMLQIQLGDDATAEGSMSTALGKLSFKHESYTTAGRPAFGNVGRMIWDTDLSKPFIDTGAAWVSVSGTPDDLSVTTGKLAANAVTLAKIDDDLLNDLTTVTGESGTDYVPIVDASDSNKNKKALLVQIKEPLRTVAGNITPDAADKVLYVTGNRTITLPDPSSATWSGRRLTIIKGDDYATTLIVDPDAYGFTSPYLNISSTAEMYMEGEVMELFAHSGGTWIVTNWNLDTGWITGEITIDATTTAPGKGSVITHDRMQWCRRGVDLHVSMQYRHTAAGTAGSGDYLFSLPIGGLQTTVGRVPFYSVYSTVEGSGIFTTNNWFGSAMGANGTITGVGGVIFHSQTQFKLALTHASANGVVGSAFMPMSAADIAFMADFILPGAFRP